MNPPAASRPAPHPAPPQPDLGPDPPDGFVRARAAELSGEDGGDVGGRVRARAGRGA